MTGCPQCWDTPCTCGYGYLHRTPEELDRIILAAMKARAVVAMIGRPARNHEEEQRWWGTLLELETLAKRMAEAPVPPAVVPPDPDPCGACQTPECSARETP